MMNQHVCRCCLVENPAIAFHLFDNNLRFELVQCVPNLNIELDDGLPQMICNMCSLRMREVIEFRRRCEDSDRELRKRFEDTNKAIDEALSAGVLDRLERDIGELGLENFVPDTQSFCADLTPAQDLDELVSLDFLLDDCSFSSIPDSNESYDTNNDDSDHVINELLREVLSDPQFLTDDNLEGCYTDNSFSYSDSIINHNSSSSQDCSNQSYLSSPTPTPTPTTVVKKAPSSGRPAKASKSLHPCMACEKKFTRNFQLKLHMISVHNIGDGLQYFCPECKKIFASRHSLNYHYKSIHSTERPFECKVCQRSFVLRTQLSSHMRTHTGESKPRIHECTECGKLWPTKSLLRTHMRSHNPTIVRPFKCDSCEKSFYTRGHLSSHMLVHTGEKPFACTFCKKTYQSIGNLNNHLVRQHSNVLPEHTKAVGEAALASA